MHAALSMRRRCRANPRASGLPPARRESRPPIHHNGSPPARPPRRWQWMTEPVCFGGVGTGSVPFDLGRGSSAVLDEAPMPVLAAGQILLVALMREGPRGPLVAGGGWPFQQAHATGGTAVSGRGWASRGWHRPCSVWHLTTVWPPSSPVARSARPMRAPIAVAVSGHLDRRAHVVVIQVPGLVITDRLAAPAAQNLLLRLRESSRAVSDGRPGLGVTAARL
jgi:hypothetical protein